MVTLHRNDGNSGEKSLCKENTAIYILIGAWQELPLTWPRHCKWRSGSWYAGVTSGCPVQLSMLDNSLRRNPFTHPQSLKAVLVPNPSHASHPETSWAGCRLVLAEVPGVCGQLLPLTMPGCGETAMETLLHTHPRGGSDQGAPPPKPQDHQCIHNPLYTHNTKPPESSPNGYRPLKRVWEALRYLQMAHC